jgi:hypothetical protein
MLEPKGSEKQGYETKVMEPKKPRKPKKGKGKG